MLLVGKLILVLFAVLVGLIVAFAITWIWLSHENIPNLISPTSGLSFDYIIVGSGTSGSVLAHELSQYGNVSILLIEAGHLFSPITKVPLLATLLQHTKNDWEFKSVSQKYSSFGLNNQMQSHPRGKGLGGSAQINYMLHFSGNQKNFESWHALGIKGWSLRSQKQFCSPLSSYAGLSGRNSLACDLSEHFSRRNELCPDSPQSDDKNQTGRSNSIWTIPKNYSQISRAFIEASSLFESQGLNFRLSKYNIRNGMRWSVYEQYLQPSFGRDNLKILSNTFVKKLIIRNGEAVGVFIESADTSNRKFEIMATKEVILSAGTFQTPQLLQVSGIGPKSLLDSIGVKQILDSKNVGANLHDHFNLPLFVSINVTASITVGKVLSLREILKYLKTGEGHFSNFGVIGSITSPKDDSGVTIFATGAIDEKALMDISNFRREDFRSLFPLYHNSSQEGFVILSTCLQPRSRGTVKAKSSNVEDSPLIDPRYAQNQHDIECTIRSIRNAVKIVRSEPFQRINAKIHWPKLKTCLKYGPLNRDFYTNEPSDEYLECLIRTVGLTGHHPGGTCSMGAGQHSVLDNKLRVRGINRLRVVDASILPTPISGTPNSVLVAVAKRAAKLILKET